MSDDESESEGYDVFRQGRDRAVLAVPIAAWPPQPIKVDHPQIRAVRFVSAVVDPLHGWADIWVDLRSRWVILRNRRTYAFTIYTPSQIAAEMEEDDLTVHNDYDQLIVRELTVPCIVDGVSKMLEMGCIDRMGVGPSDIGYPRPPRRPPRIRAIEWGTADPSSPGAEITVVLANGRRYQFAPLIIASIADELRKPSRLSFVKEGLLVVREVSDDCVRKGVEELIKNGGLERHGVRLGKAKS
ncbi:MAG: hypothetical protein A2148_00950 [Chloroflexi bacterium RBG_16_68_14]|nr:MAG: hypothetical protein A2148_00950 [Chloroflexi bacterium RBG_16_68_14]